MLCEECDDKGPPIPEFDPQASECGHGSMRPDSTLCERCSTKQKRCQACGKRMHLAVVKKDDGSQ